MENKHNVSFSDYSVLLRLEGGRNNWKTGRVDLLSQGLK